MWRSGRLARYPLLTFPESLTAQDFMRIGNCVMQPLSHRAYLLIPITLSLAARFALAFWEIEEARCRWRQRRQLVKEARRSIRAK